MQGKAPGWQVRCPKCNLKIEAGRAGLIRLFAFGRWRAPGRCARCNALRWLIVEKRSDLGAESHPDQGFAPGWQVRCLICGRTKDAGEAGLIVAPGEDAAGTLSGPCSHCGKRASLIIEPATAVVV